MDWQILIASAAVAGVVSAGVGWWCGRYMAAEANTEFERLGLEWQSQCADDKYLEWLEQGGGGDDSFWEGQLAKFSVLWEDEHDIGGTHTGSQS